MNVLVVAPHPDDEVLGVGATLLRRKAEGCRLAWLIVTGMSADLGWGAAQLHQREIEIERVRQLVGFDEVYNLKLPAACLDQLPMNEIIRQFSEVFKAFEPEEVFVPHYSDVHTDHRIVFDAVSACTKWFRYPSVRRVLAYETLSETDFSLQATGRFHPNYFVNIEDYLDLKLEIMLVYASEMSSFPFPRSLEAISALAKLRGAASGYLAAEAFELLKERI